MQMSVVLGPERFEVIPPNLQRTMDDRFWRFTFPYEYETTISSNKYDVAVSLPGDDNGPDSSLLVLAERVVAQVDRFIPVANDYLRAFIDEQRLMDSPGDWEFVGLEFGRHSIKRYETFELSLVHDGDIYGKWRVRFRGSDSFHPFEFRRVHTDRD